MCKYWKIWANVHRGHQLSPNVYFTAHVLYHVYGKHLKRKLCIGLILYQVLL